MPRALSDAAIEAARVLKDAGWSYRRIAAAFGVDHQTVYIRLCPRAYALRQAAVRRCHERDPARNWRIQMLRQAREQAQEENVPVEVICERWQIEPPKRTVSVQVLAANDKIRLRGRKAG